MLKEYLDMATILAGAKKNEEIANKIKQGIVRKLI